MTVRMPTLQLVLDNEQQERSPQQTIEGFCYPPPRAPRPAGLSNVASPLGGWVVQQKKGGGSEEPPPWREEKPTSRAASRCGFDGGRTRSRPDAGASAVPMEGCAPSLRNPHLAEVSEGSSEAAEGSTQDREERSRVSVRRIHPRARRITRPYERRRPARCSCFLPGRRRLPAMGLLGAATP